jgi:DNA-3-methyladenine glycosylase
MPRHTLRRAIIIFEMNSQPKLERAFYTRKDTLRVARELLGKRLVVPATDGTRVSGLIVETEAYLGPEDRAAHSHNNRRTARTEMMFGEGGHAYVYFIYGMYHQFNVVTNAAEIPHAVLVRALEPDEGMELMRQRRPIKDDRHLTSGPGKLCIALGLDRSFNGEDLLGERVWIEEAGRTIPAKQISSGPRIGIGYAAEYVDKPWRFWIKDNPHVSKSK